MLRKLRVTWRGLSRRLRTLYYSQILNSLGKNCEICAGVLITGCAKVSIGDQVIINDGVVIQSCDGVSVTIGNNVGISYGAKLITGGLLIGNEGAILSQHEVLPVVVEDSVWIGAGAIILPGVTLCRGAVVAAGSVVTADVGSYTAVAGVPARVIRRDVRVTRL